MAHIKKLVMQGFKSFAKRTEVPFDKGINCVIGPNGSGKSNLSDAICFVLGRLSVKSMRAEKSKNLIFMGSKYIKPAKEAFVEIVFDNSDRAFGIDSSEIVIKRGVRINGQSIYKINGETKTRAEIIETLAQAGIDPYGFNIILQGQIQSIVRMHPEERRKIIGEVAGISVYEWRKEKSLKELEKTDSKLKEISTILRERTSYLNNLEKERAQAQKFKELQSMLQRIKASILAHKIANKKKEIEGIIKSLQEKIEQKGKKQDKTQKIQSEIDKFTERVNQINKYTRESSGIEQSRLREEITDLKAELEGLKVRKEGYEHRKEEVKRRIFEMQKSLPELESEIKKLREESPEIAAKAKELKRKKEELAEIEAERKKIFSIKAELNLLKERIEEKKKQVARAYAESESIVKQIESISIDLKHRNEKECNDTIHNNKTSFLKERNKLDVLQENELSSIKVISVNEAEILRDENLKKKVKEIDICPICQSKITEQHVKHVFEECDLKISEAKNILENAKTSLQSTKEKKEESKKILEYIETHIRSLERELIAHKNVNEKKEQLKQAVNHEAVLKNEILGLENRRKLLEAKSENINLIENKYQEKMLEIEEISSRTEEDLNTTLLYKERELEKTKNIVERSKEDLGSISEQINELESNIEEDEQNLAEKEEKEKELTAKFNKLFLERDKIQKDIQEASIKLTEMQSEIRQIEDQTNYLKIGKAKLEGEREALEMDFSEYSGVELIQGSIASLEEKMIKTQEALNNIGSINLRALEVYDEIKKEYDSVKEKVDILEKEKVEILKIIEEIDKKKKRTFMKTFSAINSLFSQNFLKLSAKGTAYLEIDDQENLFEGGVSIVVKMAKGKYFDVASLSGGEQTLVALALLFAIQEYKPYQFYILDEIDAALDKRNSERLAALLNQYMKSGQYIVVTHNDAIILDSQVLYGVSMHDSVSKILSLKLSKEAAEAKNEESI